MKNCPYCAEEIQDAAIKCKHCGEWMKAASIAYGMLKNGEALKSIRQQRNISLGQLSRLSGVQPATISRMENNKAVGSLKSYFYIAKALGFKLSDLFAVMQQ